MLKSLYKLNLPLLFAVFVLNTVSQANEPPPQMMPTPEEHAVFEMGELTDGRVTKKPQIEKLGDEKYRVGSIIIDKANRLLSIPGKMLTYEPGKAIEFLATMKNGYKSYESIFMLDVNAFEFNLACILIGLDSNNAKPSKFHFDPKPVEGDPVAIRIAWKNNGKMTEYDVIELLKAGETNKPIVSEWSYTGSIFINGDQYLAQMEGVLIGLIHDPASIIEHRQGIGIGNWGFINLDAAKIPEKGQEITLKIQALD